MPALKKGHLEALDWLATPKARAFKAAYENVGGAGCVFPRLTDKGVSLMSLSEHVPSIVGVQTSKDDKGHVIHPRSPVPAGWKIAARWCAHEDWLQKVKKTVAIDQALVRWLRGRLDDQLRLPLLGDGWLLVQHRWSFGGTKKAPVNAEVVAAHRGSGQLGLISVDPVTAPELPALWIKSSKELAPYFGKALQLIGPLFGAQIEASFEVQPDDPAVFAGTLSSDGLTLS